jgi:hypothetical protein
MEATIPLDDLLVLIKKTSSYVVSSNYGEKERAIVALAHIMLNDKCWPCDASARESATLNCLWSMMTYEISIQSDNPLICRSALEYLLHNKCPTNEPCYSQATYDALVAENPTDVIGLRRLLEHAVALASMEEARQVAMRFAIAYFKSMT